MTENEVIDFLEDEISGLKDQRDGASGEIAAYVFKEINGQERISAFRTIIGFVTELKQYRKIGTVEYLKKLKERDTAKEIIEEYSFQVPYYKCPVCGRLRRTIKNEYCNRYKSFNSGVDWRYMRKIS